MRKIRKTIRQLIDSPFCINLPGKTTVGTGDTWTVVINDQVDPIVLSGGAGKNISFEIDMAETFGAKVYLFDPSPTAKATIESIKTLPEKLKFYPIGIAAYDGRVSFSSPKNEEEGSFRVKENDNEEITFECNTISTIVKEHNLPRIDILKIDIEGFEYEVIDELIESGILVHQICVEYHHFFDYIDKKTTIATQKKLKSFGYKLFHKSGLDYSYILQNE